MLNIKHSFKTTFKPKPEDYLDPKPVAVKRIKLSDVEFLNAKTVVDAINTLPSRPLLSIKIIPSYGVSSGCNCDDDDCCFKDYTAKVSGYTLEYTYEQNQEDYDKQIAAYNEALEKWKENK